MCYTKYTHRLRPNQYSFIGHLYRGNIVCIDCFYHTHKSLSSQCMLDLAKYILGQTSDSLPQCKCLSLKVAKWNVWEYSVWDFFSWQSMGMFTIGIFSMADTPDYQRKTINIISIIQLQPIPTVLSCLLAEESQELVDVINLEFSWHSNISFQFVEMKRYTFALNEVKRLR